MGSCVLEVDCAGCISSSRWKILLALLLLSLTAVLQIGPRSIYHTSIDERSGVIQAAELPCLSVDSTYWAMRYAVGLNIDAIGRSVVETNDGRIVMVGTNGAANFWLTKIDHDGTALWQRSYGGESNDYLYAVAQTQDNGFILTGCSGSFPDIWILKLDSLGNIHWQKNYNGSGANRGYSIKQTSDGGYIAAAYSRPVSNDEDFLILRLDANGNLTWNRKFGGDLPDPAHTIRETLDGGFIVAGRSDSLFARAGSAWVIKLDADGSIVWQKLFGRSWNEVNSVELAGGGGYLLAGSSIGQSGWLLRLDPNGNILWEKKYTTVEMNSELNEIKPTSDGGYIAVGTL